MLLLLIGIVVVVFIACAFVESRTTGLFQTFHVYTRKDVSWALFFPLGLAIFITGITYDNGATLSVALGTLYMGIGFFIYFKIFRRCPAMLKKICIPAIFISSCGIALKSLIFFIKSVWVLEVPEKVKNDRNENLYKYKDKIYDEFGNPSDFVILSRREKRLIRNSHKKNKNN